MPARGLAPQLDALVAARAPDHLDDVLQKRVADVNLLDGFHGLDELFRRAHRLAFEHVELGAGDGALVLAADAQGHVSPQHLAFFLDAGVIEAMAEHEAIELGLGQLERAALLDRVLRGDDQERRGQLEGLLADGDLALLHGFEQMRSGPWGRRG